MVRSARQEHSFREYVELDAMSPIKHEFLDGSVWAMAGGSPEHAGIAASVSAALTVQLRGRPCRVFSSDLRVRVKETGLATYPDVSVVCGALELDPDDPRKHTVINPRVVVEILSSTTEAYDRGEKLSHYKRIPALEEIVLVSVEQRQVEVWRREGGGWTLEVIHEGAAELRAVGCQLALDEIYGDPLAT